MTNILILAAGAGKRFLDAGCETPKPAIPINGIPMIVHAARSAGVEGRYIFITQKDHNLKRDILSNFNNAMILELGYITGGASETALLAVDYINNDDDLFVVNCDQILKYDINKFITIAKAVDGAVGLYPVDGDRWSFARVDNGLITEVAEKNRISNHGLVGLHYWKKGSDFVKYAVEMIDNKDTVNGEYYLAPVYQYAINDGKRIAPFIVDEFWEIGTPESLQAYKDMVEC